MGRTVQFYSKVNDTASQIIRGNQTMSIKKYFYQNVIKILYNSETRGFKILFQYVF